MKKNKKQIIHKTNKYFTHMHTKKTSKVVCIDTKLKHKFVIENICL